MGRELSPEARAQTVQQLERLLARRKEVRFACVHGSFLEAQRPINDIDIAVWVDPAPAAPRTALDYEWELASWLERHIPHPIDVKVLNFAPTGFRFAVSGGVLLFARDREQWYNFRGQTWEEYLDFAPLARQMLFDLLDGEAC